MDELLAYLIGQKEERVEKLNGYEAAKAEYEAAKAKLDAFGNMGAVAVEIAKLDGFIEKLTAEKEPAADLGGAILTEDGSVVGGVVDEVAVTEEA